VVVVEAVLAVVSDVYSSVAASCVWIKQHSMLVTYTLCNVDVAIEMLAAL
jgi:hypothetical protein